jgi:alkaline phosphatase D
MGASAPRGRGSTSSSRVGRRGFLVGAAAGAVLLRTGVGWRTAGAGPITIDDPFTLGVASGDPLPDRVVLWTRLAPDPLGGGGMPGTEVEVAWEVATDEGFGDVVAAGTELAVPELGHSVHADPTGLEPDSWYWYRFSAAGHDSPAGRARTAPASGCTADSLRFAFASCQNYTSGYYTAHGHLAEEGCDLVFFLGDYIYEGGTGGSAVRSHNSGEIFSLDEYRNRYALYKSDPNLQAAHASCPWIVTWDDHEVDNNYAGAVPEDDQTTAAFLARRALAYQAWWEHQPVRMAPPTGPDLRIHRSFEWGGLASLFVLDGRQYRSNQTCNDGLQERCAEWFEPGRSMLGAEQEGWLAQGLRSSGSTWNVLANQVVLTHMPVFDSLNMDQWDGYPDSQRWLHGLLGEPGVNNPVVVTGDIHASGIAELRADYADEASAVVGTELVGTSISSSFDPALIDIGEQIIGGLPWVSYVDARHRGYTVVDLDDARMRATYRIVETALEETSGVSNGTVHEVEAVGAGECSPRTVDAPGPAAGAGVTPRFTG